MEEVLDRVCKVSLSDEPLSTQLSNDREQTALLLMVTFSDGSTGSARVLIDSGCQAGAIVRPGFVPTGCEYVSSRPKRFVTANAKAGLPGGKYQASMSVRACGQDILGKSEFVNLEWRMAPYLAEISSDWDIILGHPWMTTHCVGQYPRWKMCYSKSPNPCYWIVGDRKKLIRRDAPTVVLEEYPAPKNPMAELKAMGSSHWTPKLREDDPLHLREVKVHDFEGYSGSEGAVEPPSGDTHHMISKPWVRKICKHFGVSSPNWQFKSKANWFKVVKEAYWTGKTPCLAPKLNRIADVVREMLATNHPTILVVPESSNAEWFQSLVSSSLGALRLPSGVWIHVDEHGTLLPPPSHQSCAFYVDPGFARSPTFASQVESPMLGPGGTGKLGEEIEEAIQQVESAEPRGTSYKTPLATQIKAGVLKDFGKDVLSGIVNYELAEKYSEARGSAGIARSKLKEGAVPKAQRPFRMVGEREAALAEIMLDYEALGWVEEVTYSPWAANAFCVPRKGATSMRQWREVNDYRYVNEWTEADAHPMPLIDELVQKRSSDKIFTIIDMKKGFHQLILHPDDRKITAVNVGGKRYQWRVMPMGIKNGPAIFQKFMDGVLGDIECCSCYVDDIIIGSTGDTEEELLRNHERDVRRVLLALRSAGMVAEVSKTAFFEKEVQFCGHIISEGTRRPAEPKLVAIEKYPAPINLKELRGFLGLCNYYSGYVREYARKAGPLMQLLKGQPTSKVMPSSKVSIRGQWKPEQEMAFLELKKELKESVPLVLLRSDRPVYLQPDACDYAVGCALAQKDCEHDPKEGCACVPRPVAFLSRRLGSNQLNWTVREKECYAIVAALLKWPHYLTGIEVVVQTDHRTLESWHKDVISGVDGPSGRQARWHELFSKFNLKVEYIKGTENPVGDFLSRWGYPANPSVWDVSVHGNAAATAEAEKFIQAELDESAAVVGQIWEFESLESSALQDMWASNAVNAVQELVAAQKVKAPLRRGRGRPLGRGGRGKKGKEPVFEETVFEKDWGPHYLRCPQYGARWKDALEGKFEAEMRLMDGKLLRNGKWCVPNGLITEVTQAYHDAIHVAGGGKEKHWENLSKRCVGIGLRAASDALVRSCQFCAMHKVPTQKPAGEMKSVPVPDRKFDMVSMDFFKYPVVEYCGDDYDQVLLVVCSQTGYAIMVPFQKDDCTAERTAHRLYKEWFSAYGAPSSIVTDRGPQFMSDFFETFAARMGIIHHKCVVGRHQGNGKAEVTGKLIRHAISRARTLHKDLNWMELLPSVVRLYNQMPGPTGLSPSELVFGRLPPQAGAPLPGSNKSEDCKEWLERCRRMEEEATELLRTQRLKQKALYDRNRRDGPEFKPGSVVWARRQRAAVGDGNDPYWDGPWEVKRVCGPDMFTLEIADTSGARRLQDFPADMLFPCPRLTGPTYDIGYTGPLKGEQQQAQWDLASFKVDKILGHRWSKEHKQYQFHVKWDGWDKSHTTWETPGQFLTTVTKPFKSYLQRKKLKGIDLTLALTN